MITEKNVSAQTPHVLTGMASEQKPHQFYTEASMLRWPPGEIFTSLLTELGNGLPLIAERIERAKDGQWIFVKFGQLHGCIALTVFND